MSFAGVRCAGVRRSLVALALTGAVASLTACGGDDATKATEVQADLVVVANRTAWDQPAYTVTGGTVVIALKNDDLIAHNLHVYDANTKDVGPVVDAMPKNSNSASYNLAPGTYRIFCSIPGHSNMNSTLTVK